jgi:hypothetical protein
MAPAGAWLSELVGDPQPACAGANASGVGAR